MEKKSSQTLLNMSILLHALPSSGCNESETLPHTRIKESLVEHGVSVPVFLSTTAKEVFNKQGSEQHKLKIGNFKELYY